MEKHTGECPASHGQTTGDSCCHEIGTSLIDECTAVDKPLHGWIESDIFAFGSGHTRPSIDDRGENCAFACDKVRPTPSSPRCWSQQSRISAPNSSCGQTSTVRHESLLSKRTTSSMVSPNIRRACKRKLPTALMTCFSPTSRIMRAAREKNTQTSQRPRVLHHSQLYPCLRWRQKHVGLLCHRKCLTRARHRVFCGLLVQCYKAVA